ncbi:MAG: hypothetical protein WCO55_02890 [Candidatus Falkowbacteria bacterium]
MSKKYLVLLAAVSFWAVGSVCSAVSITVGAAGAPNTATTTAAVKISKDAGVTKFAKVWNEAKLLNDKIRILQDDLTAQMDILSGLDQLDNAGQLKAVNKAITQINATLVVVDKQNVKLVALKNAAATIKDKKIKPSAQRLAKDYVEISKLFKEMFTAEKEVLVLLKTALTNQAKGKPVGNDFLTKINAFQKKIEVTGAKLDQPSKDADLAKAEFEGLTGIKLAK